MNQPRLKRQKNVATALFFLSLALLIGGLLANPLAAVNPILTFVPCLIMPIALITTIVSVRMTNEYIRVPRPEDAISESIKTVGGKQGTLYNYLPSAQHVLVTPQGVYTFLPMFQARRFMVQNEQWKDTKAKGPLGGIMLSLKGEMVGKPFKTATEQADAVEAVLRTVLPDANLEVQPVVVMVADKAEVVATEPALPIGFTGAAKRPNLKQMLREDKMREGAYTLSPAQLTAIDAALRATVRNQAGLEETEV